MKSFLIVSLLGLILAQDSNIPTAIDSEEAADLVSVPADDGTNDSADDGTSDINIASSTPEAATFSTMTKD